MVPDCCRVTLLGGFHVLALEYCSKAAAEGSMEPAPLGVSPLVVTAGW